MIDTRLLVALLILLLIMNASNLQLPDPINEINPVKLCQKCHSTMGPLRIHEGSSVDKADCRGKICQTVCITIISESVVSNVTVISATAPIVTLRPITPKPTNIPTHKSFYNASSAVLPILQFHRRHNFVLQTLPFLSFLPVPSIVQLAV